MAKEQQAPERIWLQLFEHGDHTWCSEPVGDPDAVEAERRERGE